MILHTLSSWSSTVFKLHWFISRPPNPKTQGLTLNFYVYSRYPVLQITMAKWQRKNFSIMPDTLNFSRLKWTKQTVIRWPTNKKLLPKLNVLLNFLIKTMMGIWVVSRTIFTKKEISLQNISKSAFKIERILVSLCRSKVHCNPIQGQYRARTGISLCTFPTQGKTCFHYRVSRWLKQVFPCWEKYTGNSLFSLQGWVCSAPIP